MPWLLPPTHKRCARCGEWLPVEEFRPNPKLRSGLHSWCKRCCAESAKQWREANRERVEESNARRRAEYEAARGPLPRCSECGVELDTHAKVVCSRRCKDARYRRLHP